jgi:hypothetical protein
MDSTLAQKFVTSLVIGVGILVFGVYEVTRIAMSAKRLDAGAWTLGALWYIAALMLLVIYFRQDWVSKDGGLRGARNKRNYSSAFLVYVVASFVPMVSDMNGGSLNFATFSMSWRLVGGFALCGLSSLILGMVVTRFHRIHRLDSSDQY